MIRKSASFTFLKKSKSLHEGGLKNTPKIKSFNPPLKYAMRVTESDSKTLLGIGVYLAIGKQGVRLAI